MNAPAKLPVRTRTFQSGNSVALRLPKSLGVEAGDEVELVQDAAGKILIRHVPTVRTRLGDLFGSFSADFMAVGRASNEQVERDWSHS